MSKTARRLAFAALLSASGFILTTLWYKLTETEDLSPNDAKEIARLVSTVNDVQKKAAKKIIWQSATENEVLRVGEAIRTSANSEARIEFLNSSTAIDLEPDSAIVLEESNGKLSLDFLRGNILVKADTASGAGGDSQITLKTGDKQIALGPSEITLGKNTAGGLDVQVLKGSIDGLENLTRDKIRVLRPLPGDPVYVNPAKNELAVIEWQPLPAGYQVYLEAGPNRNELAPVPGAVADGEKGKLNANMKVGRNFFRLVARTNKPELTERSSAILRTSIIAKIPPQPLYPEKDTMVTVNKIEPSVQLLWSNPAGFQRVIVEVARTADFKAKVKTEYLENMTHFEFSPDKTSSYYWRVSGVLDGSKEVISSPIQKFGVNILDELTPPALEFPRQSEKYPAESVKAKGLVLSWKAAPGADSYRVVVERVQSSTSQQSQSARTPSSVEKVFEEEVRLLQVNVKDLNPGSYVWHVTSVNSADETSKPSEKRGFVLQTLPILNWADGKSQEDHYYLTLKPSVQLKWERGDAKATNWVLRLQPADQSQDAVVHKLSNLGGEISLPKDGVYTAEVEAYDDRSTILARSPRREIRLAPAPLLPAPRFSSAVPAEIEATGSGMAQVEWASVQGAKKYVVYIRAPDGSLMKEYSFDSSEAALRNLMPGEYKLSLSSIDQHGRVGPEGEERVLKVPRQSSVRAPKLKGVKVK